MWRLGLAAAIVAGSADRTVGQARVFDRGHGGSFMVGIGRRPFIGWLAAAAAWPVAARAQVSPRRPLVAWLSGGAQAASSGFVDAFL